MASENRHSGSRRPGTSGYYDKFAETGLYDSDAELTGWSRTVERLAERLFSVKPPSEIRSFLDLGAGTGVSIDAILERAHARRIVAVDASSKMLELLRGKHPESVEIVHSNIEDYVEDCPETFDLITAWSVAELLPDLPGTIGQIGRLLKPGGVFAFTYAPRGEGEPRETIVDSTKQIGESMAQYAWGQLEIEPRLADSGLIIADRINDMVSHRYGELVSRYNFVVATKP